MTKMIQTKLLAILAVTALALVPAFALIDSSNSSASGTHDVEVKNWEQFKAAMGDARAAPEDTFNITLTGPVDVEESITIPANVNITAGRDTGISVGQEDSQSAMNPRKALVNEGTITLKSIDGYFGYQGAIVVDGQNAVFVNNGLLTIERDNTFNLYEKGSFINYGTVVNHSKRFEVNKASFTNDGTFTLEDGYLIVMGDREYKALMVNRGIIDGTGIIVFEDADGVNMGTVTVKVYGDMKEESAGWDTSKAGKTLSSEGYKVNVKDSDINEAMKRLGDKTVEALIQDAVNSAMKGNGNAEISDATVNLELSSNYAEAEYPNNMILRTAFFKVYVNMKVQGQVTAQLPDEGTYSFNDTPALSEKTVSFESVIKLEGLLRINAYFDAGEKLQRVDVILGVGLNSSTDVKFRLGLNYPEKQYSIGYYNTTYEFGMGLNISAGLDFNGFDLLSYNPGDEWDMTGTVKVADAKGHIDITANKNSVRVLDYLTWGNQTEAEEKMSEELWDTGRTTVDLTELFDMLFGNGGAVGSPAVSSGAAMAPVGASAVTPAVNGLFDTFMFTASASMGDDGYVTLTRGPASTGSIDIGEIIFDRLEEEGETAIEVNTEISGDSMTTLFTGTLAVLTGASQEDVNGVLKDLGTNYTESNMSVSEMDRICDQTMRNIDKMGGRDDSNNTTLYVMIGLVSVLAVLIAIPMFIRRN